MPDYKRTMRRWRKEDMKLGAMPTIVHKNILTRMYQRHTHTTMCNQATVHNKKVTEGTRVKAAVQRTLARRVSEAMVP